MTKNRSYLGQLFQDKNTKTLSIAQTIYMMTQSDQLKSLDPECVKQSVENLSKLIESENSWEIDILDTCDRAVITILNKNIPFLVESVGNELKNHSIDVDLAVHQLVSIRKSNNEVTLSPVENCTATHLITQFFINKGSILPSKKLLIQAIEKVLSCISFAVGDWKSMLEKAEYCANSIPENQNILFETSGFLKWLIDNNFIFLGYAKLEERPDKFIYDKSEVLGVLKADTYKDEEIPFVKCQNGVIHLQKSESRSVVHRTAHMNCIYLKRDEKNIDMFMGFFTSSVYYQSVREIPMIRRKVSNIFEKYGYPEASHNAKELITALENFPRSDLIRSPEDELYEIASAVVALSLVPGVRVFVRPEAQDRFVTCMIFMPRTQFRSDIINTICAILSEQINGTISRHYIHIGDSNIARIQITIKTDQTHRKAFDRKKIEHLVSNAVSSWHDGLLAELKKKLNSQDVDGLFFKYKDAFDIKYTHTFELDETVCDIKMIELALKEQDVKFSITKSKERGCKFFGLKIYSPKFALHLSSMLPLLENMGFFVADTSTFRVELIDEENFFIHSFRLCVSDSMKVSIMFTNELKCNLEEAFSLAFKRKIENDKFNSLILSTGVGWRQALIMRAYCKYFKQINFKYSESAVITALLENPLTSTKLMQLFEAKFSLDNSKDIKPIVAEAAVMLKKITSIEHDRVLRLYLSLILATKRTNYYKKNNNGESEEFLSFKIRSREVNEIPDPKPFMEIFIYAVDFEAIHLRGGRIARGGIRWSDRAEDFRTEILGLVKAQITKNCIIIPVGSKGGFILKKPKLSYGSNDFYKEGIKQYRNFLNGVLGITDNIVDDKISPPVMVKRYDDDDPYLAVAADKGTATFSDYANEISAAHNFWLGDAFASGGSAGYDHKKIAITARGSWISAENHCNAFHLNINNQDFTAVGVGDMSGDVFGNGLLLSKHFKLIAAFNHQHIFIDPKPDPASSFRERSRLFEMKGSKWTDYSKDSISKGGGVFERSLKSISISKEIQEALIIEADELSPDDLIKAILKAPVDLFWCGGIGTYIKSSEESNENIGDRANDSLRINGKDLRCKAVAEGANLGFTQRGRIEYARNGGGINTDFIDNSAGVSCSDREVNIKIALERAMRNASLNLSERNKLLARMTNEVAELVLQDNKRQNFLLSVEENWGKNRIYEHGWLMKNLEQRKELDRKIEFLPENDKLYEIASKYKSLSRPEIAVLIAYAKNTAIESLSGTNFGKDEYYLKHVVAYFPSEMREKFANEIESHKLYNEILATILVNSFVNIMGCCLFHQLLDNGEAPINIIKAFVFILEIFDAKNIIESIYASELKLAEKIHLFLKLRSIFERNIEFLLKNKESHLLNNLPTLLLKAKDTSVEIQKTTDLEKVDLNFEIAQNISKSLSLVYSCRYLPDICAINEELACGVTVASKVYGLISEILHIDRISNYHLNSSSSNNIESEAMKDLITQIDEIRILIVRLVLKKLKDEKSISLIELKKLFDMQKLSKYEKFLDEIHNFDNVSSVLTLIAKSLKELLNSF
ncbi:NAD-specific glutamate dehydrogenase [Candidatus Cyrtobacter comes]|uniref:NAD-specific glutamate dehydrogenase n=1 Tax=Candidatus Cyrtobacter comes TaxID=675776 RepID=A0ABU5L6J6_9RICK|nr:NAD-glutamate dehydrogenase domain-containing protein [Candidatus Cyrtobacter comes]MDZ5761748.1 NAD-specific glutamate dehydrogenase [Candidatus Cyrtobacter comes]